MKYIKQLSIILAVSFLGELLNTLLPLPVPAGIYGLLLMLLFLLTRTVRVEDVRETANFLSETMVIMFIPSAVGLVTALDLLRANFLAYALITVLSTVIVFFISGRVTQLFLRRGKEDFKND